MCAALSYFASASTMKKKSTLPILLLKVKASMKIQTLTSILNHVKFNLNLTVQKENIKVLDTKYTQGN